MKQELIQPGAVYHIFNRGNNKQNIFFEAKNYYYFLGLMKEYLLPIADVYCYCLMKNHFHILLQIKDIDDLPEKFRKKPYLPFSHLFNAYTKAINKSYNRTGSLFQEHLHRNKVTEEKYLIQLVLYIHLNPIKHKISADFKKYPYSSYMAYSTERKTNCKRNWILGLFENFENFERSHDLNRLKIAGIIEEIANYDND